MNALGRETPAEPVYILSRLIGMSGERFVLLKDRRTELPDPWTTRYSVGPQRMKEKAAKTIERSLSSIGLALQWAIARGIDLDARLDSLELFTSAETDDLIHWLRIGRATDKRRRHRLTVLPDTAYTRAMEVRHYFSWRAELALHRISVSSGRYNDASRKLEDWKVLLGGKVRAGGGSGGKKMGLPEELRPRFLEVIHPDFSENPFEPRHRKRNYALLLCYYKLGLRRAEPLVLKAEDLILTGSKPRIAIHGRPDDPEDPRPDQPSVKTADRILQVDAVLLKALMDWLICRGDRRLYADAKKHPFVFVAEDGQPMAGRTVYDLFVIIKKVFPEFGTDCPASALMGPNRLN
jgi:integrase